MFIKLIAKQLKLQTGNKWYIFIFQYKAYSFSVMPCTHVSLLNTVLPLVHVQASVPVQPWVTVRPSVVPLVSCRAGERSGPCRPAPRTWGYPGPASAAGCGTRPASPPPSIWPDTQLLLGYLARIMHKHL